MIDRYKKEYTMLGIGNAGVYARIGDNVSVSIPDSRLTPYLGDLAENGTVIDKRPCVERDDFCHMVIAGPMLKTSLPNGTKQGGYSDPIPYVEGETYSLDYVALDVYLSIWRKVGAKIGKRVKNRILWENGESTVIPKTSLRWKSSLAD